MRKLIAALQVSLDGLIEGPNGELDWIGDWEDTFDLLSEIDVLVLGGGMYPGYEQYWMANSRTRRASCHSLAGLQRRVKSSTHDSLIERRTSCCRRR
jgi:hypothetical protein